jgi:hypothetical protein
MAAETKTRPTSENVGGFIAKVEDPVKREDSHKLIELMSRVTGEEPRLWGPTIVGFGSYHYKYASGHEGDTCLTGFSPRDREFSIYVMGAPEGNAERDALLAKLGKHRMGKGCLYVKQLDDIDMKVLEKLVKHSVDSLKTAYPTA